MIDLEKEFRTLKLLNRVLIIMGIALVLGGLGMAALAAFQTGPARPARVAQDDASHLHLALDHTSQMQTVLEFTRDLGLRGAVLGVLFLGCGLLLRYMLRNTTDDETFTISDQELFKAYAEQIAAAEREKQRKRKR